jgi:hypothetical protein
MKTMILGAAVAAMTLAAGAASAQPYGYYEYDNRGYDGGRYQRYDGYGDGGGYRHDRRAWRDSDRDGTPDRREWNRDQDCDGRPDQYDRNDDDRRNCYRAYRSHHRYQGYDRYNNGGYNGRVYYEYGYRYR